MALSWATNGDGKVTLVDAAERGPKLTLSASSGNAATLRAADGTSTTAALPGGG